jgi:hypothetical protein
MSGAAEENRVFISHTSYTMRTKHEILSGRIVIRPQTVNKIW